MPKMKTKRSLAKRVKMTKSGKVKYHSGSKRHLLGHKSAKRKRHLRTSKVLTGTVKRRVSEMLPYGAPK